MSGKAIYRAGHGSSGKIRTEGAVRSTMYRRRNGRLCQQDFSGFAAICLPGDNTQPSYFD